MAENNETWRRGAMYTIGETARLAHVSSATVRRWLQGYDTPTSTRAPVFGERSDATLISFLQLIEIVMAARFRTSSISRVSLERVRWAHANARAWYDVEYPFAHLRLEAWAGHIIHVLKQKESYPALDTLGQHTLSGILHYDEEPADTVPDTVRETIQGIQYEADFAARWFPLGLDAPVVVDPRYAAGLPSVPHRGITIANIKGRFEAGQTIRLISQDLELPRNQVEEVLRYANQIAA